MRFRESCFPLESSSPRPLVIETCSPLSKRHINLTKGQFGWISGTKLTEPADGEGSVDETIFKFELFRGIISDLVNLTDDEPTSTASSASSTDEESVRCQIRFHLPDGTKLLLGQEAGQRKNVLVTSGTDGLKSSFDDVGVSIVDSDVVDIAMNSLMGEASVRINFLVVSEH